MRSIERLTRKVWVQFKQQAKAAGKNSNDYLQEILDKAKPKPKMQKPPKQKEVKKEPDTSACE